jgi:electron transfer flavoprotein beta subunit
VKIAVLIKQVPDTWEDRVLDPETGRLDRDATTRVVDEVSERALEAALALKDADKSVNVVAVSMGPAPVKESLRKCLATGADSAVHVLDERLSGADLPRTAVVLAAAVRSQGFDLVIGGGESTDGRAGMVPAMIAEHLAFANLSFIDAFSVESDVLRGERTTADGAQTIEARLPAVVSVTERMPEARFANFKGILGAKKKPLTVLTLDDLNIVDDDTARSVVLSTTQRPPREAGIKITDSGDAGAQLADFLVAHHHV